MAKLTARARERGDEAVCPLCRDTLGSDGQPCRSCSTPYHGECLAELGGCSTLGCQLQGKLPESFNTWFCRSCHLPIEETLKRRRCGCGAYLHDACVEAHGSSGCRQATALRHAPRQVAPSAAAASLAKAASLGFRVEDDSPTRRRIVVEQGRWTLEREELFWGLLAMVPAGGWAMDLVERSAESFSPTPPILILILIGLTALGLWLNARFGRHVVAVELSPDRLGVVTRNVFGQERTHPHAIPATVTGEKVVGGPRLARRLAKKPRFLLRVGERTYTLKASERAGHWLAAQLSRWEPAQLAPGGQPPLGTPTLKRRAFGVGLVALVVGGVFLLTPGLSNRSVRDLLIQLGPEYGDIGPASKEFTRRGAAAVPELEALLENPSVSGREVVRALIATHSPKAKPALVKALGHPDPKARRKAMQALRSEPGLDDRFRALLRDPDRAVRRQAEDIVAERSKPPRR